MKKTILVLIVLAAVGIGVAAGIALGQGKYLDAVKAEEAARATAAGLRAAVEVKQGELERRGAEVLALTEQIDAVREVAPSVEVREVTKWRTDRIEVPVDRLIPGETLYVEGQCVNPTDLPPIEFDVRGQEVRLESTAGNLFATGSVELYRVSPPPSVLLGSAPWRADLTEITRERQRRPPWRLSLSAFASSQADVGLGLNWQSRRRWGVQAGYLSAYEEQCGPYQCSSGRRGAVYAGVTYQIFPFRRR